VNNLDYFSGDQFDAFGNVSRFIESKKTSKFNVSGNVSRFIVSRQSSKFDVSGGCLDS
jgi:hypothetical protein